MTEKKIFTIVILIVSVILAIIAGFTAFRLYQLNQKPSPSKLPIIKPPYDSAVQQKAPEVFQQIQELPCQLTFTVPTPPSAPPSPTPTTSPSPLNCLEPTSIYVTANDARVKVMAESKNNYINLELRITKIDGTVACLRDPERRDPPNPENPIKWIWMINDIALEDIGQANVYININPNSELCKTGEACGSWIPAPNPSITPSPSINPSVSPSPSERTIILPSPDQSPLPGCWQSCTSDAVCPAPLKCISSGDITRCANPYCSDSSTCICPIAQASLPGTAKGPATQLPAAGTSLPTFILGIGGVLLVIVGLLL